MSVWCQCLAIAFLTLLPVGAFSELKGEPAPPVQLAREGKGALPIVISASASDEVVALADELATGLKKITGAQFEVNVGPATSGILVGTGEDWPGFLPLLPADASPQLAREDYLLKTEAGKLIVVGRTPLAVQNAIWDLFYRLGFRQFFPGKKWAIWPSALDLKVAVNAFESPNYIFRSLRVGKGGLQWKLNQEEGEEWKRRNRMISGFSLRTGHAYGEIIKRNQDFFLKHPEYLGSNDKLDPSHPEVLQVVKEDSIQLLRRNREFDSISLDPSDGDGWRENSPLGSPSDQAVTLANYVAKGIQDEFPGRKVGIYAYNQHSPPPSIEVDKNVIVSIATSFLRGGHSVDQLIDGWRKAGAELGIREYLGVPAWDHGLPGKARAADIDYITKTIPHFYQSGARYWSSEVTEAWGVNGLGYYLTSRLLWDAKEAEQLPALLDDFYHRAFGAAAGEMRQYFENLLLKSGNPMVSGDLIGRMYRSLERSLQLADSVEAKERIEDFVLYTRYVELLLAFQGGKNKKAAHRELAQFAQRARISGMIDRWTVFREIPQRTFKMSRTEASAFAREIEAEVDSLSPFTSEELLSIVQNGIANHQLIDFKLIAFSSNLVVPEVAINSARPGPVKPVRLRGTNRIYLSKEGNGPSIFDFQVKGGEIYGSKGPVKLALYSSENVLVGEPVATAEVPPDKQTHAVSLNSPYSGLHYLEVADGGDSTVIDFPSRVRVVFPSQPEEKSNFNGRYSMFFYVPKGTKIVGGYAARPRGTIVTASGKVIYDFASADGASFFSIPVPDGEDGECWRLVLASGEVSLLTVPPYLARTAAELLVPAEVLSR